MSREQVDHGIVSGSTLGPKAFVRCEEQLANGKAPAGVDRRVGDRQSFTLAECALRTTSVHGTLRLY